MHVDAKFMGRWTNSIQVYIKLSDTHLHSLDMEMVATLKSNMQISSNLCFSFLETNFCKLHFSLFKIAATMSTFRKINQH